MKVVIIGFAIVLIVLSCGLAVRYNQDAGCARHELDGERYKRMVAEEKLQKISQNVAALNADLKRAQDKIENLSLALESTKEINTDLRNRLDKASKIQRSLDKRISELQQLVSPL